MTRRFWLPRIQNRNYHILSCSLNCLNAGTYYEDWGCKMVPCLVRRTGLLRPDPQLAGLCICEDICELMPTLKNGIPGSRANASRIVKRHQNCSQLWLITKQMARERDKVLTSSGKIYPGSLIKLHESFPLILNSSSPKCKYSERYLIIAVGCTYRTTRTLRGVNSNLTKWKNFN